jgi:hypothetical protein
LPQSRGCVGQLFLPTPLKERRKLQRAPYSSPSVFTQLRAI